MTTVPDRSSLRRYYSLALMDLVRLVGAGVGAFGVGVWAYEVAESLTQFTLIGFVLRVTTNVGLLALGRTGDRVPTAWLVGIGGAVSCLAPGILWALSSADALGLWHVYVASAAIGVGNSLLVLGGLLAVRPMVPPESVPKVMGLRALGAGLFETLGPFIGGIVMAASGVSAALLIYAGSAAAFTLIVPLLKIPTVGRTTGASEERRTLIEIRGLGLSIFVAALVAANAVFGLAYAAFVPLGLSLGGPVLTGQLLACFGAGMIVGGIVTLLIGQQNRITPTTVLRHFGVIGGLLVVCGATLWPVVIGAAAFGVGAMLTVATAATNTVWERAAPSDMRGRIFGLTAALSGLALSTGYLAAGPLVDVALAPALRSAAIEHIYAYSILFITAGALLGLVALVAGRPAGVQRARSASA